MMPDTDPQTSAAAEHIVPLRVLAGTLAALLILTFVTVEVTRHASLDLGRAGNIAIALGIATVKAVLVALYFMHLRYDRPFNAIVLVCALLFVMLFCVMALHDSTLYQPEIQEYRDVDPARYAPALPPPARP